MPDFRSPEFLLGHIRHTLAFYDGRDKDETGGFYNYFRDDGLVFDPWSRHLVSGTRFVFNHAMALRQFGAAERPQDLALVRHGLRFLQQAHAQPQGGYAWAIEWKGDRSTVVDGTNHCYGLAFVLLAHAHAMLAGAAEAREGLDATVRLMDERFWEPEHQLYADDATPDWQLSSYRGQNANMHACEAFLAAHEATGEPAFLERSLLLAEGIARKQADKAGGLIWEHYKQDWSVDWDYGRGDNSNIFRPWGYQVGHLTEWTKLLLQLEARLPEAQRPDWLYTTARHFFDYAVDKGWDDRHGGLVYGITPEGSVSDDQKYFWVQAESLAAAALLALRSGDDKYWQCYDRIWAWSWEWLVDHQYGAWYFKVERDGAKITDAKSPAGKTDYHTMGACYDVLRGLGLR